MTDSDHILILLRYLRRAVKIMHSAGDWGEIECQIGGACGRLDRMLGALKYDNVRDSRRARPLNPRVLATATVYAARLLRQRRFVLARRVLIRVVRTAEDHNDAACTRLARASGRTAKFIRGVA